MIVAELEIFHSRPIAPTRRVALGSRNLPIDPAPGAGGVLLAGLVAEAAPEVQGDLRAEVMHIATELEHHGRVPQPAARHRFQIDQVGLTRSVQRIEAIDGQLTFVFEVENAAPVQLLLGALYAAASTPETSRYEIFAAIRAALVWNRPVDGLFISTMMDGQMHTVADLYAWNDPVGWALEILEIDDLPNPGKRLVLRQFRTMLRAAHPDHGGTSDEAAARIADLTKAREILLAG